MRFGPVLLLAGSVCGLNQNISRRSVFQSVASSSLTAALGPASASASSGATASATIGTPERALLLSAITENADDATIASALQRLVPQDPSRGSAAASPSLLEGRWELLWSAKAEAFSPLLQLPRPLRPDSFQYLGEAAATEVGPGRVAQGLTGGVLGPVQIWLSSGVAPSADDGSVLDISPPFRLQIGGREGSRSPKQTLVESESDADFRANAINARSEEAQRAPPNKYWQLYVEEGPKALRISTIVSGDPVIVGAIFVHQKL